MLKRILIISLLLLLLGCTATPFVVKDGVKYDAKAFNWDKEEWIDVEVAFNEDEATIFVDDEMRTLFLVHPSKPKNPAKIEAIDGERDVHLDIKVIEEIRVRLRN